MELNILETFQILKISILASNKKIIILGDSPYMNLCK